MRRARLSTKALQAWADLNGVELHGVAVKDLRNGQGAGLVANQDTSKEGTVFVRVPKELVLSKDLVWEYALSDPALREVLDSMGEWAQTAQGSIILFLLIQVTATSPDVTDRIGLPNPFTDYVQFLPDEKGLPSRWNEQELQCLWGTSLRNHMAVKQHSLETIFEDLRQNTQSIPWCAKWWWDEKASLLTLDDFKGVDSMFRSRAMDFGDQGQSLVPVMDMANHDHADHNVALYEIDRSNGSALLMLQDDRHVLRGYEVTINYGSDRSASDLLHAYGFIEDMTHAGSMFVSFPADFPPFQTDPLAAAKFVGLQLVPGVKFYVSPDGRVKFHSPFVYAMSINEEDGLSWDVARTVYGENEFQFFFQGVAVDTADELVGKLREHILWDLFQWRAHAYLSMLVDGLINEIKALEDRSPEEKMPEGITERSHAWKVAGKLRLLEWRLLQMVKDDFQERLNHLERSDAVILWSKGDLGPEGVLSSGAATTIETWTGEAHQPEDDSGIGDGAEYVPAQEQDAAAEKGWETLEEEATGICSTSLVKDESPAHKQPNTEEPVESAMSTLSISEPSRVSAKQANLLETGYRASSPPAGPQDVDTTRISNEQDGSQPSAHSHNVDYGDTDTSPSSPQAMFPPSFDGHVSPPQHPSSTLASPLSQKGAGWGPVKYLGRMRFDYADRQRREAVQLTEETHRAMAARSQHAPGNNANPGSDGEEDDFS